MELWFKILFSSRNQIPALSQTENQLHDDSNSDQSLPLTYDKFLTLFLVGFSCNS